MIIPEKIRLAVPVLQKKLVTATEGVPVTFTLLELILLRFTLEFLTLEDYERTEEGGASNQGERTQEHIDQLESDT